MANDRSIAIIAAVADNKVIGKGNKLPWRQKTDMKRFMALTKGHSVIMGSKTFESLPGGALKGRHNVVISRKRSYKAEGIIVAHSINSALKKCPKDEDIFIIGGEEIYRQYMSIADVLYITRVHTSEPGDAFFPEILRTQWRMVENQEHQAGENDDHAFTFRTYLRKQATR